MNLLIKDVSEEQMKAIRVSAAQVGKTIREYVLLKLTGGNDGREGNSGNEGRVGGVEAGSVKRGRDGTAVPIVRKAKGSEKRLHPVQPVRGELAEGGGSRERPETTESVKVVGGVCPNGASHRIYPNGDDWWCSDCKKSYRGEEA